MIDYGGRYCNGRPGKPGVKVGILAEAVEQEFGGFFLSFAVVWID